MNKLKAWLARAYRKTLLHAGLILALLLALLLISPPLQAIERIQAWPRQRATPALELVDASGKTWRLADFKGQVLVLNFWATWCEPCRTELPQLQQLSTQSSGTRDALVAVLAVNYKEDADKVQRFVKDAGLTLPIPLDRDGRAAQAWTPRIFPTTIVVDRHGRARWQVVGEFDWTSDAARQLLDPLLQPSKTGRLISPLRFEKSPLASPSIITPNEKNIPLNPRR